MMWWSSLFLLGYALMSLVWPMLMLYCVTITEIYIGCLKLHKVKMVSVLFIFSFLCSLKDLTNVPGMKDIANQSSLKSFDLRKIALKYKMYKFTPSTWQHCDVLMFICWKKFVFHLPSAC